MSEYEMDDKTRAEFLSIALSRLVGSVSTYRSLDPTGKSAVLSAEVKLAEQALTQATAKYIEKKE